MSQRPPQLSVVVPTHNRAWCLAEALDSVLAQDVAGVELIVVDDGSTDGTPQLLAGYGERAPGAAPGEPRGECGPQRGHRGRAG